MEILNSVLDRRSECASVLVTMKLGEYRALIETAFQNKGAILGQRDVIRQSSVATKIRKRMQSDFVAGAIFPPVVIGLLLDGSEDLSVDDLADTSAEVVKGYLEGILPEKLSIIDGMQRTSIYFDGFAGNENRDVRVEFWISNNSVKLLYRMLVLNTGQVPWNTRRQMELIYSGLSSNITNDVLAQYSELHDILNIMGINDNQRRSGAGEYSKANVIDMYLGFSTRSIKVDKKDELADEFQRFDMMESVDKSMHFKMFINVFAYLCKVDSLFCECKTPEFSSKIGPQKGEDIFGSLPACIGFVVAAAEYIIGKISVNRTDEQITIKLETWISTMKKFIAIGEKKQSDDTDFLRLDILSEVISGLPKSRIGEETRQIYKNAFSGLMRDEDIDEMTDMAMFWRE